MVTTFCLVTDRGTIHSTYRTPWGALFSADCMSEESIPARVVPLVTPRFRTADYMMTPEERRRALEAAPLSSEEEAAARRGEVV